jgi:autotransporter-associated beta strand protein
MKSQNRCRVGVRSAARKLDLACQRTLKTLLAAGRFWPLAAPAGGLFLAQSAMGQTTYKPALSDIRVVDNAGVNDPSAASMYVDVPGVAGAPPAGYTASPYPILTTSLVTATYQLVNTFTNMGPPATTAYASIGEANSSTDVSVDLGTGSGITQTNPGGAYGYASELSFNVNTLAFFVAPSNFFPANHSPTMIYQFGLGGTLPAFGSANFGVSLSFYFYQTSNTTSFSFTNTNITGTKLAAISMSEPFTNTNSFSIGYTNLTNPALYSGSALLANGQLITQPGYIDIVGSINMKASVDSQPGGGMQDFDLPQSSFSMSLPQPLTLQETPSSGNTFDVTGVTDLASAASWAEVTAGGGEAVEGPPGSLDVAQFYSGIIAKATTFSFSSSPTWGGLSVVNPGAPVFINGGDNTMTLGALGISIAPDGNGVSQDLTIQSPTALSSSQIWDVTGGHTLTFAGSTLNFGGNDVNIQDDGRVVILSDISDGGAGGSFMMNGTGMLVLGGNNSFTGGILMNTGEVSVASDANLGGVGSGLTFNGGILRVTGTTLTNLDNHAFNAASFTGGFDIVSPNNTFTISQDLGNASVDGGVMMKLGAGELYLSGSNTYTGGTTISAGTLLADSGASLGTGPVVDNAVLLFGNPGTITVTQNISGSGGLTSSQLNLVLSGNNSYGGGTFINAGDALTVGSSGGLLANSSVVNNGSLMVNASVSLGSITGSGGLTVGAGGAACQLQLTGSGGVANQQSGLSIAPGSQLDLTTSSFQINYGSPGNDPAAAIAAALSSGYHNGAWNGVGIISSAAAASGGVYGLAYIDSDNPADASVAASLGLQPNQSLIKYALAGDANLDGSVNFSDLLQIAPYYGKSGVDWAEGDFTYDGTFNFADLLLVAQNYTGGLTQAEAAELPLDFVSQFEAAEASVPEPSAAGLIVLAGAALLARRRKVQPDQDCLPRSRNGEQKI